MSPNMTSRKILPIFTSYFWPALMALIMAVFLSQWAVASPQAQTDTPAATSSEEAPPVDAADEPMKLPDEKKAADDNIQAQPTPAVNIKPTMATKLSEKCYEQTDGSFECVCEGEEECKTLETAEHCEAGTHWGKDGYGGCTKKVSE